MLDKAKAKEIAINYSKEVIKALSPEKIVLFGSHVNGIPHVESDIDIAVFVRGLDDNAWYDTRIALQNLRFNKQFVDIEPHLLDETNDPSGFALHVVENGEILYQYRSGISIPSKPAPNPPHCPPNNRNRHR